MICEWCGDDHPVDRLCQRAQRGMTRRSFLWLFGAGVATGLVGGLPTGAIRLPNSAPLGLRNASPDWALKLMSAVDVPFVRDVTVPRELMEDAPADLVTLLGTLFTERVYVPEKHAFKYVGRK